MVFGKFLMCIESQDFSTWYDSSSTAREFHQAALPGDRSLGSPSILRDSEVVTDMTT